MQIKEINDDASAQQHTGLLQLFEPCRVNGLYFSVIVEMLFHLSLMFESLVLQTALQVVYPHQGSCACDFTSPPATTYNHIFVCRRNTHRDPLLPSSSDS